MMSAHILQPEKKAEERGPHYRATERAFEALVHAYDRTLTWVLNHARTMMAASSTPRTRLTVEPGRGCFSSPVSGKA